MFTVSLSLCTNSTATWKQPGNNRRAHKTTCDRGCAEHQTGSLEKQQPQLKIKATRTPLGASKQTIIRTNHYLLYFPLLCWQGYAIRKVWRRNQIQSLWKQAMQWWLWKLVMDPWGPPWRNSWLWWSISWRTSRARSRTCAGSCRQTSCMCPHILGISGTMPGASEHPRYLNQSHGEFFLK